MYAITEPNALKKEVFFSLQENQRYRNFGNGQALALTGDEKIDVVAAYIE